MNHGQGKVLSVDLLRMLKMMLKAYLWSGACARAWVSCQGFCRLSEGMQQPSNMHWGLALAGSTLAAQLWPGHAMLNEACPLCHGPCAHQSRM